MLRKSKTAGVLSTQIVKKQTCPGLNELLSRGHRFRVRNAFWEEISADEEVCLAHSCNKIPKL